MTGTIAASFIWLLCGCRVGC